MVTTSLPKTIVKPTALGPVANTDTKLLIYGLFQKGRVLAQDGVYYEMEQLSSRTSRGLSETKQTSAQIGKVFSTTERASTRISDRLLA